MDFFSNYEIRSKVRRSSGLVLVFLTILAIVRVSFSSAEFIKPHDQQSTNRNQYEIVSIVLIDSCNEKVNSTIVSKDDDEGCSETQRKRRRRRDAENTEGTKHRRNIAMKLGVDGETFTIDLSLNTWLFSSEYVEILRGDNDNDTITTPVDVMATNCYYVGTVHGDPNSTAAISTCKGIVGSFMVGNNTYDIEPLSSKERCMSCRHKIYNQLEGADLFKSYGCGNKDKAPVVQRRKKRGAVLKWPQDLDRITRIVELYVVNDVSQFKQFNSSQSDTTKRAKDIVNMASTYYHSQNIYLVLVGMETLTTNKIAIDLSSSDNTLKNFIEYTQQNVKQAHDDAQFITAKGPFESVIVGLAYRGSMCSNLAGFFVSDIYSMLSVLASTTAHECGHTFGLLHDDKYPTSCSCDDDSGSCIMNPNTNRENPPVRWSQCSKSGLAVDEGPPGVNDCLRNIPPTVYDAGSLCGNGLVESGEDCDCGTAPSSQCNPTCCSKTTCKLMAPAQCAYGRCCDVGTCKLKPRYTECRGTATSCDLSEYCSGTDPLCPADFYKADFTPCSINSEAAYCYLGLCRTRNTQCALLWGKGVASDKDICYTQLNTRGDQYGSCGLISPDDTTKYKACDKDDVLCGTLQCDRNGKELQYAAGWLTKGNLPVTDSEGTHECASVVFFTGIGSVDNQDRGQVPSGTSCGSKKVCKKQKCVDVSEVATTCNCNNHGTCNNKGHCHCEVRFGSSDCSAAGEGGSVDSNPIAPLDGVSTSSTTTPAPGAPPETTTTTEATTTTTKTPQPSNSGGSLDTAADSISPATLAMYIAPPCAVVTTMILMSFYCCITSLTSSSAVAAGGA